MKPKPTQLIPVSFHEDTCYLVEYEGEPYAPVRPLVENLGLSWSPQRTKLVSQKRRWGVTMIVTPSPGGQQEMVCLPLRKVPAFLLSIEPSKVNSEIRPKLERYQEECDQVLWDYWMKGFAVNPRTQETKNPIPANQTLEVDVEEYIDLLKFKVRTLETIQAEQKGERWGTRLSQKEIAEMRRLSNRGLTNPEIARRLGRSVRVVRDTLRKLEARPC